MKRVRSLTAASLVAAAGLMATGASAQVVQDGNMDNLTVGTPPDNSTPAGAWGFPAFYNTNAVAEPVARPEIFTIVATNSFQTGATGNSLHLLNQSGTANDNYHLPNIWAQTFTAAPGLVLRVTFNLWVDAGSGGGSVYVGGDNGGGGFSNATGDRTAQISWLADGTLNAANNAGVNMPLTTYTTGAWQNIRMDIDTDARHYNLFWSMGSNPLTQIGTNLVFRAPNPALCINYDRISYVQFGATIPIISSYLDNIVVARPCGVDINGDGQVNVGDFLAYLQLYASGDPRADFTGDGQVNVQDFLAFLAAYAAGC
jgi:hypothetical protein